MGYLSVLVLLSAIGLSQAFLPFSMFGNEVKRSMVDSERRARALAEDTSRDINQIVDRVVAAISHADQETKKREVPSNMDAWLNPEIFGMDIKNMRRDADKSLDEQMDSLVNEIGAAADAAEEQEKKKREEPSFGEALFGGFPFKMDNLKRRRDAQDLQQQVDSVVDEIDAAMGFDDDDKRELARRGIFDCAGLAASCSPVKHCCGDYTCSRAWNEWSGICE